MPYIPDLPPPDKLGLGRKFPSWRQAQEQAVMQVIDDEHRFTGLMLPTGAGKTIVPMAVAALTRKRVLVLVKTKALQDQAIEDHGAMQGTTLLDVRGRANHPCHHPMATTCEQGASLACQSCPYRQSILNARDANVVLGNYKHWFALGHSELSVCTEKKPFDYLFVDEAHAAPGEVSEAAELTFTTQEIYQVAQMRWPQVTNGISHWKLWGQAALAKVSRAVDVLQQAVDEGANSGEQLTELTKLKRLQSRLKALIAARGYWVVESIKVGFRLHLLWPDAYAESLLFRQIPRVVFMSATLTPKHLRMLGIDDHERSYRTWPSPFDPERSPIIPVPHPDGKPVRISRSSSPADIERWVATLDAIVRMNGDRKGLIHTHSYRWATEYLERSRMKGPLMGHRPDRTANTVARFKSAAPPSYLVSPVVGTGYDFPGTECEVNILAKTPFPDGRSIIGKARQEDDPEYEPHLTAQSLAQAVGRGMRRPTDSCVIYIVDSHWDWVWPRYRKANLFPGWMDDLVRPRNHRIPPPPPAASRGHRGES